MTATEKRLLARIKAAVERARSPLQGRDKIGLKIGAVLGRRKMAKHFQNHDHGEPPGASCAMTPRLPKRWRSTASTSCAPACPRATLDAEATVLAYKSLAGVERAFRSLKTVDLEVRPVHHRLARRVRAHVFLCMLAYHVTWHMRQALAPLLFEDYDRAAAAAARPSPVAAAKVSPAAAAKATLGGTPAMANRCTAGAACCKTWPRSPATPPASATRRP